MAPPRTSPPAGWTSIRQEKSRSLSPTTDDMEDQLDSQRSHSQASPRKRKAPVASSKTKETKRVKVDAPLTIARSRLQSKAASSKPSLLAAVSDGESSDSLPGRVFRDPNRRRTIAGTKVPQFVEKKKRVKRRLIPLPKPQSAPSKSSTDVIEISSDDDAQRIAQSATISSQLKGKGPLQPAEVFEILDTDEEQERSQKPTTVQAPDPQFLPSEEEDLHQHDPQREMPHQEDEQDPGHPIEAVGDSASGIDEVLPSPAKPMSLRARGKQRAVLEESPVVSPKQLSPPPEVRTERIAREMDRPSTESSQPEFNQAAEDTVSPSTHLEPTEGLKKPNSTPTVSPVRATPLHEPSLYLPRLRIKSLLNGGVDGFFKEAFLSIRNHRVIPPHDIPTALARESSQVPDEYLPTSPGEPMKTSPVERTESIPLGEMYGRDVGPAPSDAPSPIPQLPAGSSTEVKSEQFQSTSPDNVGEGGSSKSLSVAALINRAWNLTRPQAEVIDLTLSDDEPAEYEPAAVTAAVRLNDYLEHKFESPDVDIPKSEKFEPESSPTVPLPSAKSQDGRFSVEAKSPTGKFRKINRLSTLDIIRNAMAVNKRAEEEAAQRQVSVGPSLTTGLGAAAPPDAEPSLPVQPENPTTHGESKMVEVSPTPAIIEGIEKMHVDAPSSVDQEEEEVQAFIQVAGHPPTSDEEPEADPSEDLGIQAPLSVGSPAPQLASDEDDDDKPPKWISRRLGSSRNSSAQSQLTFTEPDPADGDSSEESLPCITWETCDWWIQRPSILFSRDIPHQIQDRMNHMDEFYRNSDMARVIFEAEIVRNTKDEEPNAPEIGVYNDIDDEVTPPWEFHYSNKLYLGEGVPPPDYNKLRGCGCRGRCDPANENCLCVQRHKQYFEKGDITEGGFVYDNNGRIKHQGYPIFECNVLCGCNDYCPNRVVQNGRQYPINIVKTKEKGWGVFAGEQKIPANTFLGIYAGEYLTNDVGEERGLLYNKFGRTYLFDIDFWHTKSDANADQEPEYVVDAYHVGNFTRFLNHSCDPNCYINPVYINEPDDRKPMIVIFTSVDIVPWEELCFSYSGPPDPEEDHDTDAEANDRSEANDAIYVKCQCGAERCRGKMFV